MRKIFCTMLVVLLGLSIWASSCFAYTANIESYLWISFKYRTTDTSLYVQVITGNSSSGGASYRINGVYKSLGTRYIRDGIYGDSSEVLELTNLTPNKIYPDVLYVDGIYNEGASKYPNKYYSFTTECSAPTTPTFSNIKNNQVTVNWTKGDNHENPEYKVYRGASGTGPWNLIYTGYETSTIATGLQDETTYYFYVQATGINGISKNSSAISIQTSADPAVAAACAAQGAAEATLALSEETKASVNSLKEEFAQMKQIVESDIIPPTITSLTYSIPRVSVLNTGSGLFKVQAYDNRTSRNTLLFRYKVNDGAYTEWDTLADNVVAISVGDTPGYKVITLEVKDESENIRVVTASIWRL